LGEEQAYLEGFNRLELPILDAQGQSQWPDRFPLSKIESIRKRSGPNKFKSQMLLQPVDIAEGRLDPDQLKSYSGELVYSEQNGDAVLTLEGRRLVSASCWWDPSFGSPERGDSSVIACVFTSDDGNYWLHRMRYLTFDPARVSQVSEADQLCGHVADFVRAWMLPSVTLETNGLGQILPTILRRTLQTRGQVCAVVEAYSSTAKDRRILEGFDAPMAAGRVYVNDAVRETPFIAEMREGRPGGHAPDDGLDAVAGCLLAEPVRLPRNPNALAPTKHHAWTGGGTTFHATTTFDP